MGLFRRKARIRRLEGLIERVDDGWVFGWTWDRSQPDRAVDPDVHVDGLLVATVSADQFRPDLEEAGIGDGRHAFAVELPRDYDDKQSHEVRVTVAGSEKDLANSPRSGRIAAAEPEPPHFRNAFGGLWTDLSNATDVVDGKLSLGRIADAQAELLLAWIDQGFAILPGAVSEEAVDELNKNIEDIFDMRSDAEVYVESFENNTLRTSLIHKEHKTLRCKLLDLHSHLESARAAIFAPAIVDFLSLVFERPALAFQALSFRRASEQHVHQDSTYVRVSSPLELAASWIALEDIQPDSGELEYYVGSHRLEPYLFEGTKKWMPPNSPEHDQYLASLHEQSQALGLELQ